MSSHHVIYMFPPVVADFTYMSHIDMLKVTYMLHICSHSTLWFCIYVIYIYIYVTYMWTNETYVTSHISHIYLDLVRVINASLHVTH